MEARLAKVEGEVELLRTTLALNARHQRADASAAFDRDQIATHVSSAIAAAEMHRRPMAHLVVENLLPESTYRALIDAIPPQIFFSQRDKRKQNMKLAQVDVAPQWTLEVFGFLDREIISTMIVPSLQRRFDPHTIEAYRATYGEKLAPRVAAIPHEATAGRLMLRRPGYHLDPHLDPRRVVVTCLIYLARPGDNEAYGTSFYRINGTPETDETNTFYPEQHGLTCKLVKTVPFRPNTAVAFLNFGGAHGADIPASAPKGTQRYAYQFYISPDPIELAAVLGEAGRPDLAGL